jgi:hypothetical protein
MTDPAALPDLTLGDCADRWQISRNAIKSRAHALGVELRRESSTRTVWPAEFVPLGDELAEHLKRPKATLANYSGPRLEPLPAAPLAAPERRSVPAPPGGSGEAMLAMLAALRLSLPPPDPLATVEALHRAAELGAWLTSAEVSEILGGVPIPDTVTSWPDGHQLRPGLFMRRQKAGGLVWWRIVREAD